MNHVYPVILSGGSGSRLWPISRKHYPKQFLTLIGENTMVQNTALRLKGFNQPIAVCNQEHRFIFAEQMKEIGIKPAAIILEPEAKNTAPAIALAALQAVKLDPEAILVVLAADHLIENEEAFQNAVKQAITKAQQGGLVTFGIVPTHAETGFGYIKGNSTNGISKIDKFEEKPNKKVATEYVKSGSYFWNSGMFVFRADAYLEELKSSNIDIYRHVKASLEKGVEDLDFIRVDALEFAQCPSDSIDYAVMEKTQNGYILPLDVGWNDIGSFSALWDVLKKDHQGNACSGDVVQIDSRDCLIQSEQQLVATIGVEDLVVVSTKDSLLVTKKNRVQDVKKVVEQLDKSGRTEHLLHREVHRPWGKYDSVDNGSRYQVKRITVKPGASLSKQMHHHRAEHWIVVSGTALVEIDKHEKLLTENESVYIPLGAVHRLTNPGKLNLEIIEVQSGAYLKEDDIVRFDDHFGRN